MRSIFLILIAISCSLKPVNAKEWSFAFYKGRYSRTDLREIVFLQKTQYIGSNVNIFAFSQPFYELWGTPIEAEGQVGWHTGIQKHMELNGLLLARFGKKSGMPLNFAVGEGLSLATYNPLLENRRKSYRDLAVESEYSNKFLNYLAFEVEVSLASMMQADIPSPFFRIHHRSGVYGLFCPPTCGSNFVTYGMRWRFN
ncbi:MAG: hypothetical protein AAF518_19085 [Spirochaetota bacterium]